ncbi:hypothetical protein GQS52_24765 [Streptomyces sp. SCUT-3]|uniref:hypothetical protein n=1 Tax=Streptomyces sp. SCUT-3 TaxID=2684469 RepID=UPI0015F85FC9|nr:hypothetical protein [Streptomyces sp. SCUT-3]QMV24458.1 hypothetical protein GQS52_24765 [Streptomyces sp. SCUT-3]
MRRPGPALRVALLGVACAVGGLALLAAWLGGHAYAYDSARARAAATADGLVVAAGIGDTEDVLVRWTDRAGREHVQRFGVYATDRYAEGRRFPVAYDPDRAYPQGFPADPEETAAEDDLLVPLGLMAAVTTACCGAWARRGLRFLRAARRPGRPMTAEVLCGGRPRTAPWSAGSTWLALSGTDLPDRPARWQRVMWHPALDRLSGPAEVVVRCAPGGRGAAVVELPDGARPVPVGRLRRRPPGTGLLGERRAVRACLQDSFVLPPDSGGWPVRPWWRPAAAAAALGAAAGAAGAFVLVGGGAVAVVGFALSGVIVATGFWALSSPEP